MFIAFLYSLALGLLIIFRPEFIFAATGIDQPNHMYMWQTLGAVEVVLGFSYIIALTNPYRHWSPVVMGLLYKVFATIIFLSGAFASAELMNLKNYVFVNNLIWMIPFAAILVHTYLHSMRSDDLLIEAFDDDQITLDMFDTTEGIDLKETSHRSLTMVVFLRHFGCTFCRETLQDLSNLRSEIEAKGLKIVLVHMMEDEEEAQRQVLFYGPSLVNIPLISDPEGILYKKFKLRRGTLWQLLGGKVLFRAFIAGIIKGNGIGKETGDMTQMPGVFVMHKGEVIDHFVHESSADRPKYIKIAEMALNKAA